MSVLFISHSSADQESSARVKAWLQGQGHASLFLDFDPALGIPAGARWEQVLYQKLRACQGVVVVCSHASMASKWVFAEVVRALSDGKPVFPIRVDDVSLDPILVGCQVLDAHQGWGEVLERLDHGLRAAGIEPEGVRGWKGGCPYPGLTAFGVEDAPLFFGREEEVGSGLELLRRLRLCRRGGGGLGLVLGASGSGKSSLLRAGLVPRLLDSPAEWLLVGPFRPGGDPFAELAEALSLAGGGDWKELRRRLTALEVEATLDNPPTVGGSQALVLGEIARDLRLGRQRPGATVLLLVDQFEELLDVPAEHPAHRFLEMLAGGLTSGAGVAALGTLRSDYLSAFLQNPALQALSPGAGLLPENLALGPLPQERLVDVISKPAGLAGLRLEPALVQALLEDTGTSDALPLLAFTLRNLYEARGSTGALGLQDYREGLGGLQESVGREAERVLEARRRSLGPEAFGREEAALRQALLALVRINDEGSYARRPAAWSELPQAARPLLQELVTARLLIARGEGALEVAHEALFRTWLRLRDWLDDEREGLRLRRRLEQQVEEWSRHDRVAGYLVRDPELSLMVELLGGYALTPLERDFLERSVRLRDEERARSGRLRRRLTVAGVAVLLVILAVVGVSYLQVVQKLRQATGYRLAVQAQSLVRGNPELAKLLGAAAVEVTLEDGRALVAAENALQEVLRPVKPRFSGGVAVLSLAFQPDGQKLVFCMRDGQVRRLSLVGKPEGLWGGLWHLVQGGEPEVLEELLEIPGEAEEQGLLAAAALSPDGTRLALAVEDGPLRVWEVGRERAPLVLSGQEGPVTCLVFSRDGGRLASGTLDGRVRLWDVAGGGESRVLSGGAGVVRTLAFSGDGGTLAAGGDEGSVRLWDLPRGAEPRVLPGGGAGPVLALAFSPAGGVLACSQGDGAVRLRGLPDGEETALFFGQEGAVRLLAFSPDGGRLLASAAQDDTVRVWDLGRGGDPRVLRNPEGPVQVLAFSPDGSSLACASNVTLRTWDLPDPAALVGRARSEAGRDFTVEEVRQFDLLTWAGLLPSGSAGSAAVAALAGVASPGALLSDSPSPAALAGPTAAPAPVPSPGLPPAVAPGGMTALGRNVQGYERFRNDKDGSVMVRVPAGPFMMGSDDEQAGKDEKPRHQVTLGDYLVGECEVTNEQFSRFVSETGHDAGSGWKAAAEMTNMQFTCSVNSLLYDVDSHTKRVWTKTGGRKPVVFVSWHDARAYCRWAGGRLPTEAEWEKAARGLDGRKFPWGDDEPGGRAWIQVHRGGLPRSVGLLPAGASPYGCLDMAGNVKEWCWSCYEGGYSEGQVTDPVGPGSCWFRIYRGGSWSDEARYARAAYRDHCSPYDRSRDLGFRLARSLPQAAGLNP